MYHLDQVKLESKSYSNIPLVGKSILLRTCLNVVTDYEGNMIDDTRYQEALPLIKQISGKAKMLLITAHLWRPKNNEPQYSFVKISKQIELDIWKKVTFIDNLDDLKFMSDWVFLLENIRFFPQEDSKNELDREELANILTQKCDIFINDAFADYRPSVSNYDVAKKLPSYIWPVFEKEIKELSLLSNPNRPFIAIIWWSKLSEKLDSLLSLLKIADKVLIWWAMRYTIFTAMWINMGNSLVEKDKLDVAREIIDMYWDKLVLPDDHMIVKEFNDPSIIWYKYTNDESVPDWYEAIDIWPKWIMRFVDEISKAKTILWNGPLWVFERDLSSRSTMEIGKAISDNNLAYKLAWWWDSLAAISKLWLTWFNHLSTWWWAMLSYFAYESFPVLDIILW